MVTGFETLDDAVLLAARATRLALKRPDRIARQRKADHTPVTAADLASQAILLESVASLAPGEKVLAEESPESLPNPALFAQVREIVEQVRQRPVAKGELLEAIAYRGNPGSRAVWFIDPLDGTRGFLTGLHYAIAVARATDGVLENSWLAVPSTDHGVLAGAAGKLFTAVRARGARCRPIDGGEWEELPTRHTLPEGRLAVVASRGRGTVDLPRSIGRKQRNLELLEMDSQAKYAALAVGRADIYARKPSRWFGPLFCWDHAAGVLLVQETGGVATDLTGKKFDWTRGERLTMNQGLFAASSEACHQTYQPLFTTRLSKRSNRTD